MAGVPPAPIDDRQAIASAKGPHVAHEVTNVASDSRIAISLRRKLKLRGDQENRCCYGFSAV
jgi:hypothetical protein